MKHALLLAALLLTACAPREQVYGLFGRDVPQLRDFPAGFNPPESHESGLLAHGFGAAGAVTRTPVVFVHGNTVNAAFWKKSRAHFLKAGYQPSELWAVGYGWNSVRAFDSNDLSVPTLDAFITEVLRYTSEQSGRPVRQVDVIGHSLGVTLVRQWLKQTNKAHLVRNFVGACGGNQGVWTARLDTRGQNRAVAFELAIGSPWLAQLNRGGEVWGATRVMTLYDGTGWGDVLFPKPTENSSALKGAALNLAYNVEHGTYYDHLELPREPETMDAMLAFFKDAAEPPADAEPPHITRNGVKLAAEPATAQLHCATQGSLPTLATPAEAPLELRDKVLFTCFAHDPATHLSSPLARYRWVQPPDVPPVLEPLTLSAEPAAGAYANPQRITLKASDPQAFIVYSTAGVLPDSGAALYEKPVYVPAPVKLIARAIGPDGRESEPLVLDYNISLEKVEAERTLLRQLAPDTPEQFEATRLKGN